MDLTTTLDEFEKLQDPESFSSYAWVEDNEVNELYQRYTTPFGPFEPFEPVGCVNSNFENAYKRSSFAKRQLIALEKPDSCYRSQLNTHAIHDR